MSGILGVLGSRMVRGSARECLACEILRLPGGRRLALPVDHGLCLQAIAGGLTWRESIAIFTVSWQVLVKYKR